MLNNMDFRMKISFDNIVFAVDHNKGSHGISKIINASTKGQKFI